MFKIRNPKVLMIAGLWFLVAANLFSFYTRHHHAFGEDMNDGVLGFLYGVSISMLLLFTWKFSRQNRTGAPQQ
ncbi:MAG TPA: hypothetical protein VFN10_08665 [Thermoanaerobaculia bacterium]|nr:hypothetical protein [Thermoanaerobaculia bacterium]